MSDEKIVIPSNLLPEDGRFGAGPSKVNNEIVASMADCKALGTSHRKPAVKNLVKDCQEGMREFFKLPEDYKIAIGNGGATQLFEMAGLSMTKKHSVHFCCGEFSSKWMKMHKAVPWLDATDVTAEMGSAPVVSSYDDADFHALTHNETSTGVRTDAIPVVGDHSIIGVDATSAAAAMDYDVSKVDLYFFSPQKAFGADGGLFFAFLSPKAVARVEELHADGRYIPTMMSMKTALDNGEKNQTFNTPSVMNLYVVAKQTEWLNKHGSENIYAQCREKADHLYGWAENSDMASPFIANPEHRSYSIATIDIADKVDANWLCSQLRNNGILDTEAYRKLGRNQVRIALFPNITLEDIQKLTASIDYLFERA